MLKCKKCGSKSFTTFETLRINGELEKGVLYCDVDETLGLDEIITCRDCGEEFDLSDFKKIEFCN